MTDPIRVERSRIEDHLRSIFHEDVRGVGRHWYGYFVRQPDRDAFRSWLAAVGFRFDHRDRVRDARLMTFGDALEDLMEASRAGGFATTDVAAIKQAAAILVKMSPFYLPVRPEPGAGSPPIPDAHVLHAQLMDAIHDAEEAVTARDIEAQGRRWYEEHGKEVGRDGVSSWSPDDTWREQD